MVTSEHTAHGLLVDICLTTYKLNMATSNRLDNTVFEVLVIMCIVYVKPSEWLRRPARVLGPF
jgi:hypothetical protein